MYFLILDNPNVPLISIFVQNKNQIHVFFTNKNINKNIYIYIYI